MFLTKVILLAVCPRCSIFWDWLCVRDARSFGNVTSMFSFTYILSTLGHPKKGRWPLSSFRQYHIFWPSISRNASLQWFVWSIFFRTNAQSCVRNFQDIKGMQPGAIEGYLFENNLFFCNEPLKLFILIWKRIFYSTNSYLQTADKDSPGYKICLNFLMGFKFNLCDGTFREIGIQWKLGATDNEIVDRVSPFIGETFDLCCNQAPTATLTGTIDFTKYVEMIAKIHCRDRLLEQTEEDLEIFLSHKYFKESYDRTLNSTKSTLSSGLLKRAGINLSWYI